MNEDWEQVTPFLNEMQHCTQDDYFNPHEVSVSFEQILIFVLESIGIELKYFIREPEDNTSNPSSRKN